MDILSPFLEFEQIDDLFPLSPFPIQDITTLDEPLTISSLEYENVVRKPDRKRKSSKLHIEVNEQENTSDRKTKKIIHREVERQRRQEMSYLNRCLKSLLPPENLKGKRSLCDHLHESVNHIAHMKKKIEELSKKRNELKKSSNTLIIYVGSKSLPSNCNETETGEDISNGFIQIVLSTGPNTELAISQLLNLLMQQGLDVFSCISVNLNERLVHTIESKVIEGRSINSYELQKKLRYIIA